MQTVRASFTVPGKDGVAAAVENDPFEADEERIGRGLKPMRYVDKSALILKESYDAAVESEALVQEVKDQDLHKDDMELSVAVLEDIVPGVNEEDIKHSENELFKHTIDEAGKGEKPVVQAKYAKLVGERGVTQDVGLEITKHLLDKDQTETMHSEDALLRYISSNMGSVVLIMALTVIMVCIGLLVVFRELGRVNRLKQKQTRHKSNKKPLQ